MNRWTTVLAAAGMVSVSSIVHAQSSGGVTNLPGGFFTRFDQAMREQLGQPAYTPSAPPATNAPAAPSTRRGLPTPFDSPPYPTGEWQIGGTPLIGDVNELPVYPLQQALEGNPAWGEDLKKSRINFYGWEDLSGNLSSSHNTGAGQLANFPEVYDSRPNRLEQNQFVFYAERDPNEYQTDKIDWGFRYTVLYGLDYRYMISRGFLSGQLLKQAPGTIGQPAGNPGNIYGLDMPMMYGDVYVPWVADGMNIRIGRIISMADIEAQLAPNNLMSSHSLLYGFDPYCQWGVFTSIKLNNQWLVQAGISCGNDVAPWQEDKGRRPTGTLMVQWQSKSGKDSVYAGGNSFNDGEFGYNNLQQYVGTYTHKFNDWLWTSHETWYMYMHHATTAPTAAVPYQNGSFPVQPGYAPEWATLNYTMLRLGPGTFFTVRNEFMDDFVGSRTGYATCYTEHSVGITWWPDKLITIRPELRYDHSVNKLAFDNGTRKQQFTASLDVIYHF
jgi:hypothetical protein